MSTIERPVFDDIEAIPVGTKVAVEMRADDGHRCTVIGEIYVDPQRRGRWVGTAWLTTYRQERIGGYGDGSPRYTRVLNRDVGRVIYPVTATIHES